MNDFQNFFQPIAEEQKPLLVGMIIDVSNSMRRNWRNKDGKQLPRIEIIRDSLNKFLQEEQQKIGINRSQSNHIEMFCLGMGFQILTHQTSVNFSQEQEHTLGNTSQTMRQVDIVCDLLALSEIIPGSQQLDDFKKNLNNKWKICSKDILERSTITDDVYTQLAEYIQKGFYESAIKHFHQSISYRFARTTLSRSLFGNKDKNIQEREAKIALLSQTASKEYVDTVYQKTMRDFMENKSQYVSMINKYLLEFARNYISSALRALTLGFEIVELVEDLDEKQAIELAKYIQADLEADVRRRIGMLVAWHEKKLSFSGRQIAASLDKKQVRQLTERLIRKSGWDTLRPLVEQTVLSIFVEQFEAQARESFPYWIQLASNHEVTRSFGNLKNVLPEVVKEQVYSDQVMFGSTPFKQAIDKAAIRLIDQQNQGKKQILLIISDGEFEKIPSSMITVNLLKRRGVAIITCIVGNKNILSQLVKGFSWSQPLGTRLMIEIASKASDLKEGGIQWKEGTAVQRLKDEKLCFQINHSSLLENILEVVFQR